VLVLGRFSRHCSEIVRIAVIPIFELTNPFAISSRLLIWFCATRTKRADDSPTNGDLRQNGNTCDLIFDMSSLEHFPAKHALGLDPGVETGSPQKMRPLKDN
jgi:hypothetical protein